MKPKRYLRVPEIRIPLWTPSFNWRMWLPSRGNVLFTLLMLGALLWANSAGVLALVPAAQNATSTSTIPYQGRLADSGGNPITANTPMVFRLYNAGSGGTPLWEENWTGSNSVQVSDGLFNVMLGSLTPIAQATVTGNSNLWLGITVGTDNEMAPRVQLGTVPWAMQALTVPDGAISTAKLADGVVTQAKLGADVSLVPPDGSITTAKLADGAVSASKISLSTNSTCLGADTDIILPGNWAMAPVPTMSVPLSLTRPAKVLVIASGISHFDSGNHVGSLVFLDGNTLFSTLSFAPNTGWQPFNLVRTVPIPAGNHTLDLRTYSQVSGKITYGGSGLTTCLQYIVYSE